MKPADIAEQLRHVITYLTDLVADLETPVPDDAPQACRDGAHVTVAEQPGRCVLCRTELPSGDDRPQPGRAS